MGTQTQGTRILSIGTAVPQHRLPQPAARDFFARQEGIGRLPARLIHAAFDHSAIDTRHTVIEGLTGGSGPFVSESGALLTPATGERNDTYRREAPALFATAASDALSRANIEPSQVTHVVTVSCTGFYAPGPDFRLVKDLGLPESVERYHLGFMGCAAAFPALRAATRMCDAQPGSVVLVVCGELCSLHIRSSSDPEQIVATAVFADGAAAAVVSSQTDSGSLPSFEIGDFTTTITSEGESAMEWTIGDQGFDMTLTAEVPRIVGREIRHVVDAMLADDATHSAGAATSTDAHSAGADSVAAWAVHPGGRSVLDRVEAGLELPENALDYSRGVLRDYGNMSSATVLFILQRILEDDTLPDGARVAGLCFGPGLTVESVLLTRHGITE